MKNIRLINRLKKVTKGGHFSSDFSEDGLIRHYYLNVKAAQKLTEKRMATLIWE
jgi:hypothetical protein